MPLYTEPNYLSDVLLSEKDDFLSSREEITVAQGQNLAIGTVLGKVTIGALSETHAGNTGNGAMTIDAVTPALAKCQVGIYTATCIVAVPGGGTFRVTDPQGNVLGDVVVGGTFQSQIKFVIAAGAGDFIEGDKFLITVAAGAGTVKILAPAALDGTQNAYGALISTGGIDASATGTNADTPGVAVVREASLKDAGLVWPAGISAADKAAAIAQLEANHLLVRPAIGSTAILT